MKQHYYLILILLFCTQRLLAQQPFCGTIDFDAEMHRNNAEFQRLAAIRQQVAAARLRSGPVILTGVPDTIPVVVHIIHAGTAIGTTENPADSVIEKMITMLNQACNATFPGYPTTANGGVDLGLYFKLAKTAPGCVATNGIVRVNASADISYATGGVTYDNSTVGITHAQLAAKSFWDNERYLNIWIVNKINPVSFAGYAFYPTGTQTIYDGVIIKATSITSPYVIAHEIGHVFNLYHTFNGASGSICASNGNCATDGDMVCDTDPHLQDVSCIPGDINSCTANPLGNIVFNYMNYSCHNRFTAGQLQRVRDAVRDYRQTLIHSNTTWPPLQPAAPLITAGDVVFCEGDSVRLDGLSQNRIEWLMDGVSTGVVSNDFYASRSALVSAVAIDEAGCKSLEAAGIEVFANPLPPAPILTASGPTDICPGVSIKIFSYDSLSNRWFSNGVRLPNETSSALLTDTAGVYTLQKRNAAGCLSPLSNELAVVVRPLKFLGNDTLIQLDCYGDGVNLVSMYDTLYATGTWNSPQAAFAAAGTYELLAQNAAGCVDTLSVEIKLNVSTWKGTVSEDFFTEANWSNNTIPDEKSNVLILPDRPFSCTIERGVVKLNSLQVFNNAKFFVKPPATLHILGACTQLPPP